MGAGRRHVEDGEDFRAGGVPRFRRGDRHRAASRHLQLFREIEVFHEGYGTLDTARSGTPATAPDADVVASEGRQIVFVEPWRARRLDLSTSASVVVPAFLDSAEYRELRA